jgi:hypothetical protein
MTVFNLGKRYNPGAEVMTVFNLVKKWLIKDKISLYRFIKYYKIDVNFAKIKKQQLTLGLVQEIAARDDEGDFLIYESYGFIYVYDFKI